MGNPIGQLIRTRQAPGQVRQYLSDSHTLGALWNNSRQLVDRCEQFADAFDAGLNGKQARPVLETIKLEVDQFYALGTQYEGAEQSKKALSQRQTSFANLITLLVMVGTPLAAFAALGLSSRGLDPKALVGIAGAMQKVPLAAPIVAGAVGGLALTGAIGLGIAKAREKQLHANWQYAITRHNLRFVPEGVTYV